jgi:hypothetical protein
MMQIILFTIVGISLYFFSDYLVRLIETRRGKVLDNRSVIFFVIFLILALVSFELIQRYVPAPN